MMLSVIVPARDEERALPGCLRSLTAQSEPGWLLGEHWELLVALDEGADGNPVDRTGELARGFAGVTVVPARALPHGQTGKAHACQEAARGARGEWLLFTDADTVHAEGSASRALVEADRHGVALLSWSPRRVPDGLLARALGPLAESEIATAYQAARVNDPARPLAYAAGEFLLVKAEAYRQLGGHARVAESLTPEVDLAFAAKKEKLGLRYRHAPEMLRSSRRLESWRFALLVNNTPLLAAWRVLDVLLVWGLLLLALLYPVPLPWERIVLWLLWVRTVWRVGSRAARSGAPTGELALSIVLGLPVFAAWAYRGWYRARVLRRVTWKGREYPTGAKR